MISRSGQYPGTLFDPSSSAPGITLPPGGAASSLLLFFFIAFGGLSAGAKKKPFLFVSVFVFIFAFVAKTGSSLTFRSRDICWCNVPCVMWLAWNGRFGDYMYGGAVAEGVGARFLVWWG